MRNQRVLGHFRESIELQSQIAEKLVPDIARAADVMFYALSQGNKILACGNGASASDCRHFAAKLLGRFERERLPLPAIALSVDTFAMSAGDGDFAYPDIYRNQVQALGQAGDVLLALTTTASALDIEAAIDAALERDMRVVALTGAECAEIVARLTEEDIHICIPHERAARVQEIHLLTIHCLCDGIDAELFGGDVND